MTLGGAAQLAAAHIC